MTSRLIADSEHMDHVTILLARVCAARLDPTIKAEDFVRSIARLVDVAIAEAIEDAAPLPHVRVSDADRVSPAICVYCGTRPQSLPHVCDRMRELGLTNVRDFDEASAIGDRVRELSTGAAAAETKAAQTQNLAPTAETPAAPSISIAEPVSPPHGSNRSASDAGASPAVESESADRAEASQPRRRKRFTGAQLEMLRSDYMQALAENDGSLPGAWIVDQAEKMGVSYSTIYGRITWLKSEAATTAHGRKASEHTRSSACWCRRGPNNSRNPWCANAPTSGRPVTLADPRASLGRPPGRREYTGVER